MIYLHLMQDARPGYSDEMTLDGDGFEQLSNDPLRAVWARTIRDPNLWVGGDPTLTYRPPPLPAGWPAADEITRQLPLATLFSPTVQNTLHDVDLRESADDDRLPRYHLNDEIGRGGMGLVQRAKQNSLGREVAIKRLISSPNMHAHISQFVAEARVTGYLDHPNIIPVYELAVSDSGEVFLAMKLVRGIAWSRLLHPQSEEDGRKAAEYDQEAHLRILLDVGNAIKYAHARGIIHRDLKPDNVMVGEFGEVLVMDWGLAAAWRDDGVPEAIPRCAHLTAPAGTPAYMAPEQAEGQGGSLGPRTDIYLLGAILHEIMVGRPPHTGETLQQVLVAALMSEPPTFPEGVPDELAALCRKSLAVHVQSRPHDVASFQDALRSYLKHRQSVTMAARAQTQFDGLKHRATYGVSPQKLYPELADIRSRFCQALELWRDNRAAWTGLDQATQYYAEAALKAGDLSLADSLAVNLASDQEEAAQLRERIAVAQRRHQAWTRRVRVLRLSLLTALGVIAVVVTVALISISRQRRKAEAARVDAEAQRKVAVAERAEAETQRQAAERQRRTAERRLADSLVAQGDALLLAGRMDEATARYRDAADTFKRLGQSPLFAHLGLWDAWHRMPPPVTTWHAEGLTVSALAFAPDGRTLAAGSTDGTIVLRDLVRGTELRRWSTAPDNTYVWSLRFSPDGRTLALGGRFGIVSLWRVDDGKRLYGESRHQQTVHSLAWAPDGSWFASGGQDGQVIQWPSASSDQSPYVRLKHQAPVRAVAVAPDGRLLSADTRATLAVSTGSGRRDGFDAGIHSLYAAGFIDGGRRIWAAGRDGVLRVFEADTGHMVRSVNELGSVHALAVHDNGMAVLGRMHQYANVEARSIWSSGGPYRQFSSAALVNSVLALAPDGRLAATGGDGTVQVWWTAASPMVEGLTVASSPTTSVAWSPDENLAALGDAGGIVQVFDVRTGRSLRAFLAHNSPVTSIAFAPDGKRFYCGAADGTVCVGDVRAGTIAQRAAAHDGMACVAVTPNGRTLATGGGDGQVKLWDAETLAPVATLSGHDQPIGAVAVTSDGKWLLSGSADRSVRLWGLDAVSGRADTEPAAVLQTDVPVGRMALSRDGRLLAVAARLGQEGGATGIAIWDIASRKQVRAIPAADGSMWLRRLDFADAGAALLACEAGGDVRAWRVQDGREFRTPWSDAVDALALSPSGRRAIAATHHPSDSRPTWPARARVLRLDQAPQMAQLADVARQDDITVGQRALWYRLSGPQDWSVMLQSAGDGEDLDTLLQQGCIAWESGRRDAAREAFEEALRRPNAPDLLLGLRLDALRDGGGLAPAVEERLLWRPADVNAAIADLGPAEAGRVIHESYQTLQRMLRADPTRADYLRAYAELALRIAAELEGEQPRQARYVYRVLRQTLQHHADYMDVSCCAAADRRALVALAGLAEGERAAELWVQVAARFQAQVAAGNASRAERAELAKAFEALAQLEGAPGRALKHLLKAREQREAIMRAHPRDSAARQGVARNYMAIAQALLRQDKPDAAARLVAWAERSVGMDIKRSPTDPAVRLDRARVLYLNSQLASSRNDNAAAATARQQALAILRDLEQKQQLNFLPGGVALYQSIRQAAAEP